MNKPVQCWEFAATPGQAYTVMVHGVAPPSAVAILEWYDGRADNNGIAKRIFLTRIAEGWQAKAIAPPAAKALRVLVFHWTQSGAPQNGDYECVCSDKGMPTPRRIKAAVAHQRTQAGTSLGANIALMCEAVRAAGEQGVELLCLTENFPDRGVAAPLEERALTAEDERLAPLFEAIRAAKLYAVWTMHEQRADGIFNTAFLVAPTGEIMGRYAKCNLTLSEWEAGVTPGDSPGVFDTPLGKIGIVICWDAWFPESALQLAKLGAEIVCFPFAGDGTDAHFEHVWRARALDNQVFWLASATANCCRYPSRIIAPNGAVLAETGAPNTLAIADLDLDEPVETFWLSVGPYLSETRNVYDHSRVLS